MALDFGALRDRCGLAPADVAAEFGESLDAVFLWEAGEVAPPDRVLRSLSIMANFSAKPVTGVSALALLEPPGETSRAEHPTARQRKSQLDLSGSYQSRVT